MALKDTCFTCQNHVKTIRCMGCHGYYCQKHYQEHRYLIDDNIEQPLYERRRLSKVSHEAQSFHDLDRNLFASLIKEFEANTVEKMKQIREQMCERTSQLVNMNKDELLLERKYLDERSTSTMDNAQLDFVDLQREVQQFQDVLRQLQEKIRMKFNAGKTDQIQRNRIAYHNIECTSADQNSLNSKMLSDMNSLPNVPSNAQWSQYGITVAGGHSRPGALNQLYWPVGLALDDKDGTMFITDHWNHRIIRWKQWSKEGCVIAGRHGAGNRLHQLNKPTDILIDKDTKSLLICDFGNRRVLRWSLQNGVTHGEVIINNIDCYGLTKDNEGSIYISDSIRHDVRKYQRVTKGMRITIVAGGNGRGNRLDQLYDPRHIVVDHEYNLYISDHYNNRVVKWMKNAQEGVIVAGSQNRGEDLSQLSGPTGIAVDMKGTVYVADSQNNRLMRWPKGATRGEIIVNGSKSVEKHVVNHFGSLFIDSNSNIWIVDRLNHRVQRFDLIQ